MIEQATVGCRRVDEGSKAGGHWPKPPSERLAKLPEAGRLTQTSGSAVECCVASADARSSEGKCVGVGDSIRHSAPRMSNPRMSNAEADCTRAADGLLQFEG